LGRFVEDEISIPADHGAPDRQHLLLATRQAAGGLCAPLCQHREQVKDSCQLRRPASAVGLLVDKLIPQVLDHRERTEQLPPLRRIADSKAGDFEWAKARDVALTKQDAAA